MHLSLDKKDLLHAVALRWQMVSCDHRWRYTAYETRATLRARHAEHARSVVAGMKSSAKGVYDLDPDLVAFAKRSAVKMLITSYLISFATVGLFAGLAGLVVVEIALGWWWGIPETKFGAPVNPAYVIAVTWPVCTLLPAIGIAWLRGAWRSFLLVRHAAIARKDAAYLLPLR